MNPEQQPGRQIQPQPQQAPVPMPNSPATVYSKPDLAAEQYKFIVENEPKKRKAPNIQNASLLQRILIVTVGLIVLITGWVVISNMLNSGKKKATEAFVTVSKQQEKILFLTNYGTNKPQEQPTRALAASVYSTVLTDQTAIAAKLKKSGYKFEKKQTEFSKKQQDELTGTLERALQKNEFDTAYTKEIRESLADYQAALETAYDATGSASIKELFDTAYTNAKALSKANP